jgi:cyclomaltodextrinase
MDQLLSFKHTVIYHILIDRFAGYTSNEWQKPGFLGGNLKGITERFNYLKELGVSAIWLSPFYKTTDYHGYHITDFLAVEPSFGTVKDLKALIELAHKNGFRVIADFVPNHCAREHPFFQDALEHKNSPYTSWFLFKKWPEKYLCFMDITSLPKLNLLNPETGEYIIRAAKYWLGLGLDGFRIDHVIGLPHSFIRHFQSEIEKEYPGAVLIGEAWLESIPFKLLKTVHLNHKYLHWLKGFNQEQIQHEYIDLLDGVLDFYFRKLIVNHLAIKPISQFDENHLKRHLNKHYGTYPDHYILPTFLDNHDLNRFLFDSNQEIDKLKKAVSLQMSIPQPAVIYYGSETGLTHDKPVDHAVAFSDLEVRKPMPWDNLNSDLIGFYKDCITRRKSLSNDK